MKTLPRGYGSRLASMKLGIFCMCGPYKRYKYPTMLTPELVEMLFFWLCVEISLRIIVVGHTEYPIPIPLGGNFTPIPIINVCFYFFDSCRKCLWITPDKDSTSIRDPSFRADPDPNCGVKISQISS